MDNILKAGLQLFLDQNSKSFFTEQVMLFRGLVLCDEGPLLPHFLRNSSKV